MRDGLILRKLKAWCLILLTVVVAQALVPISAPEARTSGSPFNPSTIDVSTGHDRRDVADRQADPQRDPDDGPGTASVLPIDIAGKVATTARASLSRPVAPPALACTPAPRCALSQPRAPPFA